MMFSRNFIDLSGRVDAVEHDGELYAGVTKQQDIPDEFLARLRHIEENREPGADMRLCASIPVIFVEKWMREGFNVFQESAEAIEAKLKAENLHAFLVK